VSTSQYTIQPVRPTDVPAVVSMVYELAEFEQAPDECHLTEDQLHAALFGPRDRERAEHDDEQEEIIDAQRLLEQVRGEPLLAELASEFERDERAESDRDGDPGDAPRDRAPARIDVIAAMGEQIDRETTD